MFDRLPRLAVVFVSYRVPAKRLADHFRWNEMFYAAPNIQPVVVTDQVYDVPAGVEQVVDLRPMPVFSIARTKNLGIERAMELGATAIMTADVDVAFDGSTFAECYWIQPGSILRPYCRMARSFETRDTDYQVDEGMASVCAARAEHWRTVRFDERLTGYGGDDWQIVRAFEAAGVKSVRAGCFYHIAHDPDASQENTGPGGRADCWNRQSGFNPDNSAVNNRIR